MYADRAEQPPARSIRTAIAPQWQDAFLNEAKVVAAHAGQNRLAIPTGTDQRAERGRTNIVGQ
jgi:hypothetical protein